MKRTALLLATTTMLAACSEGELPTIAANDLQVASSVEVMFNPQPDPPRETASFLIDTPELIDNPNLIDTPELRPWVGTYIDAAGFERTLRVETILPATRLGATLRLKQSWDFGADSGLPAVQVDGMLNLRSGRLVLRGFGVGGGLFVIQGWATSAGGVGSIAGELMFNPQPDPPLVGG